ncbi:MAG TPA: penicillin-binding protein activator, partial [Rhodanobacteraceae bacterium]|nr:penicillin-binding protein activator [Rhodanobacteraceae bacterium]
MLPFRRHRLPVFALTAAVLLMAGCASLPNAPTPQQQAATDNAAQLYRQGNFDAAAQAYLALAGQHRAGREANLLLAVESYRQENAWDKAAPVLEEIASRRLDADQLQHYAVLRAEAAEARGDYANAIALSQDAATLTPAWRGRALEVRARAQAASGQPLAAVRTRLTLDASLQGFDREQNQQQILDTLGTLDRQALNTAGSQLAADDPLKPWIAQAIAKQGGALAQTLPQLNSPVGTMLPGSTREGYQPPHHVALLLPLSSPLAAAATAVRDGFLEAQRADPEGASMQVEVIDSGASVNSA